MDKKWFPLARMQESFKKYISTRQKNNVSSDRSLWKLFPLAAMSIFFKNWISWFPLVEKKISK